MGPARRVRLAVAFFATVVLFGFLGYQVVERMSPLDALYMTVITITTVGFGEVRELDAAGKVFTIGLIAAGVASVTIAVASAAEFVVEGHLRRVIGRRRMERDISTLREHVIICGFGRVGRHLAAELAGERIPFVVVDNEEAKLEAVDELGYLHIEGDATEEHVLAEAGLTHARAVVACVNSDADNALTAITAKGIKPDVVVIARAKADENEAKMRRAGADRVIAPTTIGGRRIAQLLTRPVVADFLELVAGAGGLEYSFEEVPVVAGSQLDGASLRAAALRERFGCTVLAVRQRDTGEMDTHPEPDITLHAGDVLVIIGSIADVSRLRAHFAGLPTH